MTFEEAGAQFARVQAQWRNGALATPEYEHVVDLLRVEDQAGWWWRLDPRGGQWTVWNGSQWVSPQQVAAASTQRPRVSMAGTPQAAAPVVQPQSPQALPPQQVVTVHAKPAGPAMWEGFAYVIPGFAIDMLQRWPVYRSNPSMLVGFVVPALLPAVLVPLVPRIGRVTAIAVVLGCLAWLSWPVISQASTMVGNAGAVQSQAGRGLVGVSLVYLIPRIWRAGR
jgi:hypothetical protein